MTMTSPVTRDWQYRWFTRWLKLRRGGFTLIELLVAIIIGSIIVTVLLQLVLELLQVERRETAIDNVQRDMRRALDYVSADVQEAIYVYPSPSTSPAIISLEAAGAIPAGGAADTVLAFWRVEPLDNDDFAILGDCSAMGGQQQECEVLKVRQATYSLIVYRLETTPNATWDGQARIVRYRLPKYTSITSSSLNSTPGYSEPLVAADPSIGFETWQVSGGTVGGNTDILVDYVDNPVPDAGALATFVSSGILNCPDGMQRSPDNTIQASTTSFFACVQDPTAAIGNLNQDVEIFLRGNIEPRDGGGLIRPLSESSALPTLKTGVLVRGVIDKDLDN
jgi:prepilin-type N-terminal cleavage/methylation domain-containing protein